MSVQILMILNGISLLAMSFAALHPQTDNSYDGVKGPIDFTLQDLHGQPVKLSAYRGKVVVVDVWATWCGYCVDEVSELIAAQRLAVKNKQPWQLIGIAVDENIDDVRRFAAVAHFNYPILYKDDIQMQSFGMIDAWPTKFIINKQGEVVDKIVGAVPMETLSQHVARYLK